MNLQDMLREALLEIESMTVDKFEECCLEFGYQPKRKPSFILMPAVCPVVVEVGMKADTIVKPKKSKKWSEWRKHTTGNVPKDLDENDIVKVKLRNLPKGNPFTVRTGCWVECGDYTIMEYKVKLKDVPTNDSKYSSKVQEKPKSKWTKNTGVLPVDSDIEVQFKRRDCLYGRGEAGECDWRVQGQDYDIIKWRLAD